MSRSTSSESILTTSPATISPSSNSTIVWVDRFLERHAAQVVVDDLGLVELGFELAFRRSLLADLGRSFGCGFRGRLPWWWAPVPRSPIGGRSVRSAGGRLRSEGSNQLTLPFLS